jgi:hypothetical protein
MQIDFPCDDATWFALDPFTWKAALQQTIEPPSFRNALRELAGRGVISPDLTEGSLWILLHGLISVSWTLLWRDLGELSMIHDSTITRWKDSLRRAFLVWRNRVRKVVEGETTNGAVPDLPDNQVSWNGVIFAYLGCVLLLTDTEQIRIFAGASSSYR